MFQDSDDWSGARRLELLLGEAERTGADLIGCQEMRLLHGGTDAESHGYPVDASGRIRSGKIAYAVLHPTSLVSRDLVMRLGGYASGMRFAADTEFQLRAAYAGRVTNVPEIAYFRRMHPDSLTESPETGRSSPARTVLRTVLRTRWKTAIARAAQGLPVDLAPMSVRPAMKLRYILGPDVRRNHLVTQGAASGTPGSGLAAAGVNSRVVGAPIFIVGAPRSGHGLAYAALAHHRCLTPIPGATWLTARLSEIGQLVRDEILDDAAAIKLQTSRSREVKPPFRVGWLTVALNERQRRQDSLRQIETVSLQTKASRPELASRWVDGSARYGQCIDSLIELFPEAQFIHVVREPVEVVRAMMTQSPLRTGPVTATEAINWWLRDVEACLEAERKYGSEVVLRVLHHELIADPNRSIHAVLDFVGEEFEAACLLPFGPYQQIAESASAVAGSDEQDFPESSIFAAGRIWDELTGKSSLWSRDGFRITR